MQGKIVIGTEIDDSGFNKDLSKLERKQLTKEIEVKATMENLDKEETTLKTMLNDVSQLEKKYYDVNQQIKEQEKIISSVSKATGDGKIMVTDYPSFEKATNEVMRLKDVQSQMVPELEKMGTSITRQEQKVNNMNLKYQKQKNQLVEIGAEIDKNNIAQAKNALGVNKIGGSLEGIIKKVKKWGLAIFGVRSAYIFLRQSMSVLTQYNEQLGTNIQYIKFALATTLLPIVEKIVDLVYKFLMYLNYILQAWFGINLFARATTQAFQKQNKVMGDTGKKAKELQKTLAGFDEMNILNENGDVTSGGGGGGIALPTQDLSNLSKIKIPKWLEWIKDNKELILSIGTALLAAFATAKIVKVLNNLAMLFGTTSGVGLIGMLTMLKLIAAAAVIAVAVYGVAQAIKQFKELKKAMEEVTKQQELNKTNAQELSKEFWNLQNQGKLTEEQIRSYATMTADTIDEQIRLIDTLEDQKTIFGELTGANEDLWKQQDIAREKIRMTCDEYKKLYQQNLLDTDGQRKYKEMLEKAIQALDKNGESTVKLRKDYEMLTGKPYTLKLKAEADTASAEREYSNFFTKLANKAEKFLSTIASSSFMMGGVLSSLKRTAGGFRAKGGIYYPSKLPKLAVGGIINRPGPGIPYHGATIGERGAEAVVPLTDSQQMALLGEAIGKYITINANIVNTMNGRVISKELKRVNNETDFAYNG